MSDQQSAMQPDMLRAIFELQTVPSTITCSPATGCGTTTAKCCAWTTSPRRRNVVKAMVNDLPNQWLLRYAKAMEEEFVELKAELRWKWWSKDGIDLQNIRVELVDLLHFLVSAMISAGLTADKVHDLYRQKHAVNVARQDAGYCLASKTEDDNRGIR